MQFGDLKTSHQHFINFRQIAFQSDVIPCTGMIIFNQFFKCISLTSFSNVYL